MKKKRVLILEDEASQRDALVWMFKQRIKRSPIGPFSIVSEAVDNESDCYKAYNRQTPDLVILDLRLSPGKGDGLGVLSRIRKRDKETPIIVLSGMATVFDWQEIGRHPSMYFYDKTQACRDRKHTLLNLVITCITEAERRHRQERKDINISHPLMNPLGSITLYDKQSPPKRLPLHPASQSSFSRGFNEEEFTRRLLAACNTIKRWLVRIKDPFIPAGETLDFASIQQVLTGLHSLRHWEQLLKLDPKYRDHFVHQFRVYLLGGLIAKHFNQEINKVFSRRVGEMLGIPPEQVINSRILFQISWFLTAMFHDSAYPVQLIEKLLLEFFEANFHYRFPITVLDAEKLLVINGVEKDIEDIVRDFWKGQQREEEFRKLLMHGFVNRNHGIHSAVALRRLIRYHSDGEGFCRLFAPVFSAIALHDWAIWSHAHRVRAFLARNRNSNKQNSRYEYNLDFSAELTRNPLLHLLLIADNIQDWGRPRGLLPPDISIHLELIDVKAVGSAGKRLRFELAPYKGAKRLNSPTAMSSYTKGFRSLSAVLGEGGLPITIALYKSKESKAREIVLDHVSGKSRDSGSPTPGTV